MIKFRGKTYDSIEEIKEEYKYTDLERLLYLNRANKGYFDHLNYYAELNNWHGIRFFKFDFLYEILGISQSEISDLLDRIDNSTTRLSLLKEIESLTSFNKACRANGIGINERKEIKQYAKEKSIDEFEAMWIYIYLKIIDLCLEEEGIKIVYRLVLQTILRNGIITNLLDMKKKKRLQKMFWRGLLTKYSVLNLKKADTDL